MKRRTRRRQMPALLIAALMILAPVLFTYYAFARKIPFLSSQYVDYAIVPNSLNVRPGAPVRVAGVDVGKVTGVSAAGNATRIAFSLDGDALPLHTDATVTVRDRLFLEGGYYLALDPGSPTAPTAAEGFTIRPRSTQTPVQFFQVLSTFDLAARADLEQLLNTANAAFSPSAGQPFASSGAAGFKAAIPQLTPVLKDTAWVSQALSGTHAGDVQTLLSSSAQIFATLQNHGRSLAGLVDNLDTAASALASSDGALASSIAGLDGTLREALTTLTAVDRSLDPLSRLAAVLTPTLRQSPQIVTALTRELLATTPVIGPGNRPRLLGSLRTLLARFPAGLSQLARLFPVTKAVTDCLATHITPALEAKVQDGALTTGREVWQEFVQGMIGLASASGDYDPNGHYLRILSGTTSLLGGLGSLPGLGPLVGTVIGTGSTSSSAEAVAPQWVGDLAPSAFRPDIPCTSQPLPSSYGPIP
jgi:virulence factor Mce-like protein